MELPWGIRIRIGLVLVIGLAMIGPAGLGKLGPAEPFEAAGMYRNMPSSGESIFLVVLAAGASVLAYYASRPYGLQIAPAAVPVGLSIYALCCGTVGPVLQLNPTLPDRQEIYGSLKWEGLFWIGVVLVGQAAVLAAEILSGGHGNSVSARIGRLIKQGRVNWGVLWSVCDVTCASEKQVFGHATASNSSGKKSSFGMEAAYMVAATAVSAIVAYYLIGILAKDVKMQDSRLGSVIAQPSVGQVSFAVITAFTAAGFVTRRFFRLSYVWPTIATFFVSFVGMRICGQGQVQRHLAENWPACFFPLAVGAIFPVQMVGFGAFGSLLGFWLAMRYEYWRKHASGTGSDEVCAKQQHT
ncbi:MAG: hypothetical protein ABIG61_04020 [Planctomycetota bacterium]